MEDEFKYIRLGYTPGDTFSDECVQKAVKFFPNTDPDVKLPKRWTYKDPEDFKERFGEGIVWVRTASYHNMYLNGYSILRLWTTSPKTCRAYLYVNNKFSEKVSLTTTRDLYTLLERLVRQYGI